MRKDVRPKPTKRQRQVEWGITVVMLGILGLLIIGPPWKRFMPPEGMETIDDLIAVLPETYRFAAVEHDGTSYVVWVGRPRGPIVSGPPVCVFATNGRLVDWSGDTGDSNNQFVREMHARANQTDPISKDEAIAMCRP
ncbi:hypothetical protein [Tautonia marina]|uniref:hypothetical protein n=1 Tax=Tautonia marina TaxID=2653855 RepID=UPI001260C9FB|nr:hypothetical protein [Tautonia marina]